MAPILTLVLICNFLLLLYLGCTAHQRSTLFGYSSSAVQGHQGPLPCHLGVFVAEEVDDGIADNGSGHTTTVEQTLLKDFLNMVL